jgi:hypothetical protein
MEYKINNARNNTPSPCKINGYEDYLIYEDGSVYSIRSGIIKKPHLTKVGYLRIELSGNGKPKRFYVHRLVGIHFIENPDNLPEINHGDGIKQNCHWSNLEWSTHKKNIRHAYDTLKVHTTSKKKIAAIKSLVNYGFSKSIPIIAIKNGIEELRFDSLGDAHRLGYRGSSVSLCINGKKKQYKGYTWKTA